MKNTLSQINKQFDSQYENKDSRHRRSVLKGLLTGSVVVTGSKTLPEKWSKPVTDAVVLPGHAVTTRGDFTQGDYGDPAFLADGDEAESNPDGYGNPTYGQDSTDTGDATGIPGEYDGDGYNDETSHGDYGYGDNNYSDEEALGDGIEERGGDGGDLSDADQA